MIPMSLIPSKSSVYVYLYFHCSASPTVWRHKSEPSIMTHAISSRSQFCVSFSYTIINSYKDTATTISCLYRSLSWVVVMWYDSCDVVWCQSDGCVGPGVALVLLPAQPGHCDHTATDCLRFQEQESEAGADWSGSYLELRIAGVQEGYQVSVFSAVSSTAC